MPNNHELEELDKTTPNTTTTTPKSPNPKNESTTPKPRPFVIISAAVGLICFFLPWLKLTVMGFVVYTVKGFEIPAWADTFGQWAGLLGGSSGSLLLLYLLYFVPALFVLVIGLEMALKSRFTPLIGLLILILLLAFLAVLIYNLGISEVIQLLSVGLYGSLIAGIVVVYSKK